MFNHRGGRALADAVTEIILVCRLSQKHMWDKVNLDIHGMMRARLAPLGKNNMRHVVSSRCAGCRILQEPHYPDAASRLQIC